jgi:hypothetical protein
VDRARVVEGARRVGLPLALAGAFVGFALFLNHHEPVRDWLFLRYAAYWLLSALFAVSCLASGHAVVVRVLGRALPLLEHVTVAFAAGVYVFFLGTMLGGLLGLYGRVFFFALPIVLLAITGLGAFRYARRAARHVRGAWRRSARPPVSALLPHAFGLLGLGAVYFAVLTPNNAAFDARWYHLGIAEHYAALGAVQRFPEGWFPGASPHLASLLYTWAFLVPSGRIFDRIELAAHVEMTIFVFSLLGIPALVRRLVRPSVAGGAYRYAWAARFLFPGVFLYDSSVCLGADHVASVFAAPIYLSLLLAWRSLAPRACALLALALTGALLTKYTGALILVAPAIVALAARVLVLAASALRRRDPRAAGAALLGPLVALFAGTLFTAPHWVKNLIWYGDPSYPVLHKLVASRPWTADSALRFDVGFASQLWPAERSLRGLGRTLGALGSFSFVPNDWERFHGATPVFGSLFTLSLLALPFLKGTKRLWGIFVATHLGVAVWYWVNHQDRYLQAALPWMAAATAATLGLVWRRGLFARGTLGALVALQIVWGADVYFMPGHVFTGVSAKAVIDLLSRIPGKAIGDRLAYTDAFATIGHALPPRSKVLVHEWHPHLGLEAPSVTDCPHHQGGISYLRTPSPREAWDQLHGFGVTHVVYKTSQPREPDTLAGEIAFFNFVQRAVSAPRSVDGWLLGALAEAAPPPGGAPDPVLVVSCGKGLPDGLYHLEDLAIPAYDKRPAPRPFSTPGAAPASLVATAAAVAQDHACAAVPAGVEGAFVRAGTRDPYQIWVRR